MKTKMLDNSKLGVFVTAGVLFLVLTLYMIGKNRDLLGSTFTIIVEIENVNGLVPGNNVRYKGIDVGTVKNIRVKNDTTIHVTLIVDEQMKPFIKQNAIASIGTDGLMGNKLININPQPGPAETIKEGSIISALDPIETEAMIRTLNSTNNNIALITRNLEQITGKLNRNNSLWSLLGDSVIANDLKMAVKDIRRAGENTSLFTAQAEQLILDIKGGKGLAGALVSDSSMVSQLSTSLANIESGSREISVLLEDIQAILSDIKKGDGTAGKILNDTLWSKRLEEAIINVQAGSAGFNQNMEALKHNFLFRRYFKKQQKAQGSRAEK